MTTYEFHPDGTLPAKGEVFVFGSNLAGRHGKGAALIARQRFGAKYGVGSGYMAGTGYGAHSYAVPTKDASLRSLTLSEINYHVEVLRRVVSGNQSAQIFFVTRIGCGLAGYGDADIAPMFRGFPANCSFPNEWAPYLND